jgi:hypothetical protein
MGKNRVRLATEPLAPLVELGCSKAKGTHAVFVNLVIDLGDRGSSRILHSQILLLVWMS